MMKRISAATLLAITATVLASCDTTAVNTLEYGVSQTLAQHRAKTISDVSYDIRFSVPPTRDEAITGSVKIGFMYAGEPSDVVLDFRGDSGGVGAVTLNGDTVGAQIVLGHIVLPSEGIRDGNNSVELAFTSSNEALNRNDEYMYALFVPDRASTAFPSFDQPDIKARYKLVLEAPSEWRVIANGMEMESYVRDNRATWVFAETQPIPTYLFTFAAGKFLVEEREINGRTFSMLHRETDSVKVARNVDAIFSLHATSLQWLEDYTQLRYSFGKFAFLAVPSFQFGGMEHPGAVWYRASSLFLDESATQSQKLGRASLIAHETAHMWFGNLVTMRWFNDVWMKEVFANFMAAKIVQPSFNDINHDLRFYLSHHPTAYGVDRTRGTNAIRQPLENLRQAGSLYGAIIYQKAPIVMRQLERMVGDSVLREGVQKYLTQFKFGNASWLDLVSIIDSMSPLDVRSWSRVWVEEPGRPLVYTTWKEGNITVHQSDSYTKGSRRWQQQLSVMYGYDSLLVVDSVVITGDSVVVETKRPQRPDFVLVGADAYSYGRFLPDSTSIEVLLTRFANFGDPVHRATAANALWEAVLSGDLAPDSLLWTSLNALKYESDELVAGQLLGYVRTIWWRFLSGSVRNSHSHSLETKLWTLLDEAKAIGRKSSLWGVLVSVSTTDEGLNRLFAIWNSQTPPKGLPLSEQQYTSLLETLLIQGVASGHAADSLLDIQSKRISNPDMRARFAFVRPSLSRNTTVRDSVFQSLLKVDNRRRESWATDALRNLNHPLRQQHAIGYIEDGLAIADEIQRTGDIFFPLSWMNALLDGHSSSEAAHKVAAFLDSATHQQPHLRGKMYQAADDLFRSARVVHNWKGGPSLEGESSVRATTNNR